MPVTILKCLVTIKLILDFKLYYFTNLFEGIASVYTISYYIAKYKVKQNDIVINKHNNQRNKYARQNDIAHNYWQTKSD